MDVEQLVTKAKQGNEQAFRILVEAHKMVVFRAIMPIIRNPRDAEELAQDVFVRIYYALPSYHGKGFKTWITRIAVNMAIDEKRKRARRAEEELGVWEEQGTNDVEEHLLRKETRRLIHERMEQVPANYREVLIAYYIKEKSYQEIAEEQQVKIKTVETKLYRARKWLKARWKEEEFR